MVEDAAQEECLCHLRHPVALGYRWLRDRTRHHRELPNATVPAERAGHRAADHGDLSPLRPERPPDRDPRPRHAKARLLLPIAARQSSVRAWSRPRRTCLYGRVLEVGSGGYQAGPQRAWPRGFCSRLAATPWPGVGRRHHPRASCREKQVMNRISRLAAVGTVALAVSFTVLPSLAQVVVFDPNNYAQNVLTAARALQQINNQITSLQNQTQMLINQAKNLANLPFSSLQQLQLSIQRTQQLLSHAQRIAYDVQQIDRAFSTTYAPASASTSSQTLISNAQGRWQTSVAALQDALRVQAGVVANLDTNRTQMSALVTSSQSATGALQATQAGNQLSALLAQQLADLTATVAAQGRAQSLEAAQRTSAQDQGREQLRRFLTSGVGYQPTTVQMFH